MVSKFVTVVVQPKESGETGIECYMVSDQCQALERDNVFGNSESRKNMILREAGPNEMIPSVVKEGKPAKEFEPDFFIVSLGNGQPRSGIDYRYLKYYDFPVYNRGKKEPTVKDFQDYLKRHKGEPSQKKYASFQLLVFLAEFLDPHTAQVIADQVAKD
jgi:NPL4 family